MDYSRLFAISAAGMAAERTRVEVVALNIANANTVAGAEGAYQPQQVVLRAVALGGPARPDFASQLARASADQAEVTVPRAVIEPSGALPRTVYDPGHPSADAAGFVRQPGVDAAREMLALMSAMRAYEANVAVATTSRSLALKTLEIGGGA